MEKLIKNPTFLMIGAGVLAFAVANMIMNRKPKGTTQDEFSNFAGCTCANGVSGSCATDCGTCCARSGGADKGRTRTMYGFEG